MGWLREITNNWSLKWSFLFYELCGLLFSIPIFIFVSWGLSEIKYHYFIQNIGNPQINFFGRMILSKYFNYVLDFAPLIIIGLFLTFFFYCFYKDHINPVVLYAQALLQDEEKDLLVNNELSLSVHHFNTKMQGLEETNLSNILKIQDYHKLQDTVMHEIKNPLAVIKGDITILKMMDLDADDDVGKILKRLERNELRIEAYLNNLSLKKNIASLKINLQTMDVQSFISLISREIDTFKSDHKIKFVNEIKKTACQIVIDPQLLTECLHNVLKNADAFANNTIQVTVKEQGNYLYLEIQDDGLGFSFDALKNYSKPYFTENPTKGNMGLGLYLSDMITKKMNIQMKIFNSQGAHVQFIIVKC